MTDTKMLQAIADRIASMDRKMDTGFKEIKDEMRNGFKNVNGRLDSQGASLAYLEDDAPTIKDFNNFKKRVKKLEIKVL